MRTKLNSNHKRVLSATVKIVDEEIKAIKRVVLNDDNNSKINLVEKTFDEENSKNILSVLESLEKMNAKLFDDFELTGTKLMEKQIVYSKISYLWTILTDSHSKRLKSFGKLDDADGRKIDEYLDKMLLDIEKILI